MVAGSVGSARSCRPGTGTTRSPPRMRGRARWPSSAGTWEPRSPMPEPDDGYRRLFVSHPAAMAIWDPATGRILAANDAAVRQYGYSAGELTELTVDRIVHPDDLPRLREQVPNLGPGLAGAAPFRHVRRSGEVIEVEMSGHPLEWEGRPARLVMAIDVTARRRLEGELRSARAIEAVGRLAGGIGHDFNNLVMAINGFAELLLERVPAGSEEHDAVIEIRTAGLRAAALTGQLLAFARPHEPRPRTFDLNELIADMAEAIRGLAGPNVDVGIAASAAGARIHADREQIARAIVGCVLNARDAMPDGGQLIVETSDVEPSVARELVGARGDQAYVALAISDTGPPGGLEPAATGGTGPAAAARTGLGLALVYSTIQLAGGRIRLESPPGRGSTVRILFPMAGDAGSPEASPSNESGASHPRSDPVDVPGPEGLTASVAGVGDGRAGAVIVVVEDEPGVRSLVERVLVRAGHQVVSFADGAGAAEALADPEVRVDLLVTDLVMPGPNGLEVARLARRARPD